MEDKGITIIRKLLIKNTVLHQHFVILTRNEDDFTKNMINLVETFKFSEIKQH
jgi:hypothetical protein